MKYRENVFEKLFICLHFAVACITLKFYIFSQQQSIQLTVLLESIDLHKNKPTFMPLKTNNAQSSIYPEVNKNREQ